MNTKLFSTGVETKVAPADTLNAAGGRAYKTSDEHTLAQYVVTSCFNKTFYASDIEQVQKVLELANSCHTHFVAKAAVYGHEVAGMKDTPALLLAVLAARAKHNKEAAVLFTKIFPRIITNTKMLFNFVQVIRSGVTGRKSFGTLPKRAIRKWLENKTGNQLFTGSIGANPSIGDVIKMVHPKAEDEEKNALYAYFIDKKYDPESLPPKARDYEIFKQIRDVMGCGHKETEINSTSSIPIPDIPFQFLANLNLTRDEWAQVIRNMPWNALRMNLNTAARHGVFSVEGMTEYVAGKLSNADEVRKHNVFPYQLLSAYLNTEDIPAPVKNALQDAMEVATENVPAFEGGVAVCMDTSGSMGHPVTGHRKGATTKVRCVDVAALVGASLARKNKDTTLIPFDTRVHDTSSVNVRDSIMTNADKLRRFGGGGTDCASALRVLNGVVTGIQGSRPKTIIFVSDNESWMNSTGYRFGYRYGGSVGAGTPMAEEWLKYQKKTPDAKLILIDIEANANTQVQDMPGVMNIGGFSDKIWPAIESFVKTNDGNFVGLVNKIEL